MPSETAIEYIRRNEGPFITCAKRDRRYWVVGWGAQINAPALLAGLEAGGVLEIDQTMGEAMLRFGVQFASNAVEEFAPGLPDGPRRMALTDAAFTLGRDGLFRFGRMRQAIMANDWVAAARELLWNGGEPTAYARQVGARAERNAEILRTGVL